MKTEELDALLRIFRDTVIVLLATFMLVYETVFAQEANVEVIGAALALFGLPPVLRLDLRNGKRREIRADDDEEEQERWSHLP